MTRAIRTSTPQTPGAAPSIRRLRVNLTHVPAPIVAGNRIIAIYSWNSEEQSKKKGMVLALLFLYLIWNIPT
jgi:hypothetical protein